MLTIKPDADMRNMFASAKIQHLRVQRGIQMSRPYMIATAFILVYTATSWAQVPSNQPGMIAGNITDARGQPLQNASVYVYGFSDAGSNMSYKSESDENGRYSLRVAAGRYTITAFTEPIYQGRRWRLPLHPTDNKENEVAVDAQNGVRKNFRWQLSGAFPHYDPDKDYDYYGGRIHVKTPSGSDQYPTVPDETTVSFTLRPTGRLIDGSEGRALTFTRTVGDVRGATRGVLANSLNDIPIGSYTVRATMTLPHGHPLPLFTGVVALGLVTNIDFVPDSTLVSESVTLYIGVN